MNIKYNAKLLTKTFGKIGIFVNEYFGRDHSAEGREH